MGPALASDRYRELRYVHSRVTDDAEGRVDGGATEAHASGEVSDSHPHDSPNSASANSQSDCTADDSTPESDAPIDFGDLSLPQRIFVAAVQNPTRGVVIVGLFAFAFSFYVAFWMVFPRVAAFMSGIGFVLVAIVAAVYLLSDRFSG